MRFRVTLSGSLGSSSGDFKDPVFEALNRYMASLCEGDALSPGVQYDAGSKEVTLTVNVDAGGPAGAVNLASAQIRSALHAAGFGTPDWPEDHDNGWTVEFVSTMIPHAELVAA